MGLAHAFAFVAIGEPELLRGALLPTADRVDKAGAHLAPMPCTPEDLAAGPAAPAPLVAEFADLEGARLIDAEPCSPSTATKAAHALTSSGPALTAPNGRRQRQQTPDAQSAKSASE